MKAHYSEIPVFLETGYADDPGTINDTGRVDAIRAFANEVLKGLFKCFKQQHCLAIQLFKGQTLFNYPVVLIDNIFSFSVVSRNNSF